MTPKTRASRRFVTDDLGYLLSRAFDAPVRQACREAPTLVAGAAILADPKAMAIVWWRDIRTDGRVGGFQRRPNGVALWRRHVPDIHDTPDLFWRWTEVAQYLREQPAWQADLFRAPLAP